MIDEQLLLFDEADTFCQTEYGTSLATIHSESQNQEAIHVCSQSTRNGTCSLSTVCWIGGEDIFSENETLPIWIDGTTMNYTDFYQSYTDDNKQNEY